MKTFTQEQFDDIKADFEKRDESRLRAMLDDMFLRGTVPPGLEPIGLFSGQHLLGYPIRMGAPNAPKPAVVEFGRDVIEVPVEIVEDGGRVIMRRKTP